MRLIDADELLKNIPPEEICSRMAIDNAPTVEIQMGRMTNGVIIPITRPQGEWTTHEGYDGDEYYECSVCKDAFVLMEGTPKDNNYNFCPNCGADMRGDNNG